jgi:hypothetical protein
MAALITVATAPASQRRRLGAGTSGPVVVARLIQRISLNHAKSA